MTANLLLVHGDDGFGIDRELIAFAERIGAAERAEIVPQASPDTAALDRAQLESAMVGLFGARLAVLRQPLRAVGRATAALDRLLQMVEQLPDGGALALAEVRPSRDVAKPPAALKRLADAVTARGGAVVERMAPRRGELVAWVRSHAASLGTEIEPAAAKLLAERIGGAIWETDVERGEQTRMADAELRKLATFAGERAIVAADVEALTADTRPASVFAITNAIDRREAAAAAEALRRALEEGQPVLRIVASIESRLIDLITARDLVDARTSPAEIAKRVGRGNARAAERVVEAARRYSAAELEAMLVGLFEADLAIKTNAMDEQPAIAAWVGEYLLGAERVRG
jgi:DNA polymerase III delta subunit